MNKFVPVRRRRPPASAWIVFGIGAVVIGHRTVVTSVRSDLAREQIVGTPDSSIPGQRADSGSEAQAFAKVMR
jgi:hypothetical protein